MTGGDGWVCVDISRGGAFAGRVCASRAGCRLYGPDGRSAGYGSPLDSLMVSAAREWGRRRRLADIPGWDLMSHEEVYDMVKDLAAVLPGYEVAPARGPLPGRG
jgi:hypothetical protein